jgi:hypothetical protein
LLSCRYDFALRISALTFFGSIFSTSLVTSTARCHFSSFISATGFVGLVV